MIVLQGIFLWLAILCLAAGVSNRMQGRPGFRVGLFLSLLSFTVFLILWK